MSIEISERVIFNKDGLQEIRVESSKGSLCINSADGYESESTGHVRFMPEQLAELIQVLQIFQKERND